MIIHDRLIGTLAILGGLAIFWGTLGFRQIPGQQFGSAFFPEILAVALVTTGIVMIATAPKGQPIAALSSLIGNHAAFKTVAVLAAVIGWLWLVPMGGFLLTTAVLIAFLSLVAGARIFPAICVAIGASGLLYMVFGVLLRVPLPIGLIEGLL